MDVMTRYSEYDALAPVYDAQWRFFVKRILPVLDRLVLARLEAGASVLDVCCGTGLLASELLARGFHVTGLDGSSEMLAIARGSAPRGEFVLADARDFAFDRDFDAAVSTFDSLNHILSVPELQAVFDNVRRSLRQGGRFVFDLNLEAGFVDRWNGQSADVRPDLTCIGRATFDPVTRLAQTHFTLFLPDSNRWTRRDVVLTQRCFAEQEVIDCLLAAGFQTADVEVHHPPSKLSGRGVFHATAAVL
jgi:SAM-dependent methyltransferase